MPCIELQTSAVIKSGRVSRPPQVGTRLIHSRLNPGAAIKHQVTVTPSHSLWLHSQDNSINELAPVFQQQSYISRLPPPEPGIFTGDPIYNFLVGLHHLNYSLRADRLQKLNVSVI